MTTEEPILANRVRLTSLFIQGLKPKAAPARRYVVYDAVVPPLAVRVSENGHKSFILAARFPGSHHHTRRLLGNVEGPRAISLSEARKRARTTLAKIGGGMIDPKEELRRQKAAREAEKKAALRAERTTFSKVVHDFAETVLRHQRRGRAVERQLLREFVPRWADRQIDRITPLEVSDVVREVAKRGAVHEAHNLLGAIRRLYTWAISCGAYGLEHSPCDRLKPKDVIGVGKTIRRRVLTDEEIRALWQATAGPEMSYPFAPMYRLLLITGTQERGRRGALDRVRPG